MQALTLHIELFVHHSLLFRLYNLLCRTAQHAQPFVPKVNLICTNIFMCKVLRKNNFSSNHSTSKNLITKIQNYLKMSSEKESLTSHRAYGISGFYALSYKLLYSEKLKDVRWQKVKNAIQIRDEFTCQKCGEKNKQVQVHHRHYISGRDPWDYPEYLLVLLCSDCHKEEENCAEVLKELVPTLHCYGYFNTDIRKAVNDLIENKTKNGNIS